MEAKYYIEYKHPTGDYYKSPVMSITEMEKKLNYSPITEQLFIDLMKQNFKKQKNTRESNIQIIKEVEGIKTVLYEQKKF